MTDRFCDMQLRVNGEDVRERVEARKTLVDFLRDDLGLTGSHIGCEQGVCGACTVLVDGEVVRGCLVLAVQCDGAAVETIEGVSDSGAIADLQDGIHPRNALQCGFCTPGMLIGAQELLSRRRRAEPRRHPRTHFRQLLPLHRLSGDRRRDRSRGAGRAGAQAMKIAEDQPSGLTALDRPNSYIGRSVPRPNLARLTQGRGQYVTDVVLPRMAHVAFVRSPHAHARIKQIDDRGGKTSAGRPRRRHRRRTCQGDDALGRRADASQGHQIGAAIRHRRRPRLLAGRSGRAPWSPAAAPKPRMPAR